MKKLSKRSATTGGCLCVVAVGLLSILQIILLTLKLTGAAYLSWWETLYPIICMICFPFEFIVVAVIVLAPKMLINHWKLRKRVEAEAKKYGMERKPGESTEELNKRIIRRNMIAGDYTKKDIKNEILNAFPNVGSCQILVNNQSNEIVLNLRGEGTETGAAAITDEELQAIIKFAAMYIPDIYKVTIKRAEGDTHDGTET